jgi:hypothetical protein
LEATTTTTRDDTFLLGARLPVTAKQIKKGERHSSLQEEKRQHTGAIITVLSSRSYIFSTRLFVFT